MTFLWPQNLWFLAAIPLVALGLVALRRRRAEGAQSYPGLAVAQGAAWRWLPAALFALALAAVVAATARPATQLGSAADGRVAILALDVAPSRLAAAQAAARSFVASQPGGVRIGVVAFSETAQLMQAPSTDRDQVLAAIARLEPQEGTAIGRGLLLSLKAIFPESDFELDLPDDPAAAALPGRSASSGPSGPPAKGRPAPAGDASAIILLTDGQNTDGPAPIDAARLAADRGVRVYTIGVGTPAGRIGDGQGWSMTVGIDEQPLKEVAGLTSGEYFHAATASDLKRVYSNLGSTLTIVGAPMELTALFCAFAALAAAASALLSLAWFGRIA
jgi:Ca-activated chloride channel family protein